jgi:xanthine dehydrogenase YagS FAD-binding subunit
LGAKVTIAGPGGLRTIPAGEFFGTLGNRLEKDEMVSVASVIAEKGGKCEDARIVMGAVAPVLFRAVEAEQDIKGKPIDRSNAEAAVADAVLLSENAYKVAITKTLVTRALVSEGR